MSRGARLKKFKNHWFRGSLRVISSILCLQAQSVEVSLIGCSCANWNIRTSKFGKKFFEAVFDFFFRATIFHPTTAYSAVCLPLNKVKLYINCFTGYGPTESCQKRVSDRIDEVLPSYI